MTQPKIGIVTGANKGIGYAIVKQLALQYPGSAQSSDPLLVYLTARDVPRGVTAVRSLHEDAQLKNAKALRPDGGKTDIKFHQLDISDSKSVVAFVDFLKEQHPDGIDFIINNAGVAFDGFNSNIIRNTLRCNYYGNLEATEVFLALLKPSGGRIVNVASMAGLLHKYTPRLKQRWLSAQTVDGITTLVEEFANAVKRGKHEEEGWPSSAYAVSKAGEIAMTRIIARRETDKGGKSLINVCCPGWVTTDMTKNRGTKTPDQGAQTPVLLAIGDIGGKTGLYWTEEEPVEWK